MINPTPESNRLNPQELKGDDLIIYEDLADDLLKAQQKLDDAKNKPFQRKEAQQARINQLTVKVNDAQRNIDMFLAEPNSQWEKFQAQNTGGVDVQAEAEAKAEKRSGAARQGILAPKTDTMNFNPPSENEINKMAKGLGINTGWLKTIAGVGMKILPFLDEEILLSGPATLAAKGLEKAGLSKAAAAVTGATSVYSQYETYWMLFNVGLAAINQLQGEIGELSPELQTLIPGRLEGTEPKEFDNAEQFMKDFNRWQRFSPGMQAWKYAVAQPLGYQDNFEMISSAFNGIKGALGKNE